MDTLEQKAQTNDSMPPRHNNRIWGGLFLLVVGGVFLLREMDYPFFPDWLFTWPMILIAVGIFSGIKHNFRGGGWFVMLLVGGVFLADQMDSGINFHRFMVPIIIIGVGLMLILRPKRWKGDWDWKGPRDWEQREQYHRQRRYERNQRRYQSHNPQQPPPDPTQNTGTQYAQDSSVEDYIDSTSVFGGVRKIIVSKNFKGGEATSFMGGTELDLTQADINGTVILELNSVMGGTKLILPPHWSVKSEVTAVFGGIDDKRQVHGVNIDPGKVLVLKGTAFLGGIEIRNY